MILTLFVPVRTRRPESLPVLFPLVLPDQERIPNEPLSLVSELLSLLDLAALSADESLLIFLGHVLLAGDALVQLVPHVIVGKIRQHFLHALQEIRRVCRLVRVVYWLTVDEAAVFGGQL